MKVYWICYIRPMQLLNKKLWVVCLVVWFSMLQAMSPFVHAHLGGDNSDQMNGLHIHEFNLLQKSDLNHHVSTNDFALDAHIVVIDIATRLLSNHLFSACALIFVFIFCCQNRQTSQSIPRVRPLKKFNDWHSPLKARAPPQI
ncbi:MAG: hypothetical protein SFU55_06655 [Methylophilus sp.]|nr:hypothetical protein [Methylophilus sp.]